MKTVLVVTLVLIALPIGFGLWWRVASRHHLLPCPSWLSWVLESPYMEAVASSAVTLERLNLVSGMRVLDVGCGSGRIAVPAAARVGPNGQIVALDLQSAMLKKLEERATVVNLTNIQTVLAKIGQGVLEDNAFDRALLVQVLGEIPNRKAALKEIHAALKPGGILSVTEVIPDPHYQSRSTVRRLAEAAGFHLVRHHGSWLAFTMNFVKPYSAVCGKRLEPQTEWTNHRTV